MPLLMDPAIGNYPRDAPYFVLALVSSGRGCDLDHGHCPVLVHMLFLCFMNKLCMNGFLTRQILSLRLLEHAKCRCCHTTHHHVMCLYMVFVRTSSNDKSREHNGPLVKGKCENQFDRRCGSIFELLIPGIGTVRFSKNMA
jgi:hypothetical protein